MARLKLELNDFPLELGALGFYSDLQAIKLCYHLNTDLGFRLKRMERDFSVNHRGNTFFFMSFEHTDEKRALLWHLVENRGLTAQHKQQAEAGLFEDTPQQVKWVNCRENFDYFMWFEEEEENHRLEQELWHWINQLPYVKAASRLNEPLKQKIKKNLSL